MKVCMFSLKGNFDKNLGQGVQRMMHEMRRNIGALMDNGADRLDVIELGFGKGLMARKISFTLASALHDFGGYDIIHSPAPIIWNPTRRGRAKMVTTLPELALIERDSPFAIALANSKTMPKESSFDRFIQRNVRRQLLKSDYVICVSNQVRDEAVQIGCDPKRLFVVHVGIDERFVETQLPNAEHECFTVGYLGGMITRKNVGFVINSFKSIKDRDIMLNIYGKKSGEYENLVKLAGDDKRISFMGFASEDKLVEVYDSFDVMIYPVLYAGFDMEIIEAQSRGVPVILYKKATITEEARKYCFEAEDEAHAARIVLDIKNNGYDPKRRKEAMAYARSFTWKSNAEKTVAIYRKILE
ncbi:MAG: glycosyltransferase [Candidatus Micrarchaeota archaeon]|nr:glycosyltransferase [Candidatus Micrarchaeota archaeon]